MYRLSAYFGSTFAFVLVFLLCPGLVSGQPVAAKYDQRRMDTVPDCGKKAEIERIINEAISLGAPIYNEGLHMACYRVYEWAAYKILYVYGKECPETEKILKTAIDRSHGDLSDTEKAWLMRMAFDKILGVPTQTTSPAKEDKTQKG